VVENSAAIFSEHIKITGGEASNNISRAAVIQRDNTGGREYKQLDISAIDLYPNGLYVGVTAVIQ
jgi:hypothetical protein